MQRKSVYRIQKMQSDEERTLGNLCVLAAVSHNDKLCTLEDAFTIYAPTSMRGLVRMWYGERRAANVQRVRQAVRAAIGFAQQSLEEVNSLREAAGADAMRLRIGTTRCGTCAWSRRCAGRAPGCAT